MVPSGLQQWAEMELTSRGEAISCTKMSILNFCIYSLEQLLIFTGLPKYQSCHNELKPPCQKCSHEGRYFSPLR